MKRATVTIAIALISILCGCAQPPRYDSYPSEALESRHDGQENLLHYPDNWPEISDLRDRSNRIDRVMRSCEPKEGEMVWE